MEKKERSAFSRTVSDLAFSFTNPADQQARGLPFCQAVHQNQEDPPSLDFQVHLVGLSAGGNKGSSNRCLVLSFLQQNGSKQAKTEVLMLKATLGRIGVPESPSRPGGPGGPRPPGEPGTPGGPRSPLTTMGAAGMPGSPGGPRGQRTAFQFISLKNGETNIFVPETKGNIQ